MLGDEQSNTEKLTRMKCGKLKPDEIKKLKVINKMLNDCCIMLQDYTHSGNRADKALKCIMEGMSHLYCELDKYRPLEKRQ